jgi:methylenetetrahydrofolate dehydrogenase (NADP+) / methenyltetrahydrofolate cyclohydrolase
LPGIYLKLTDLAEKISGEIKEAAASLNTKIRIASLIANDDQSCISYLKGIRNRAEKLGMQADIIQLDSSISEKDFLKKIDELNKDPKYSGIIIQVPIPKHIDFNPVASALDHKKDIDCITPYNMGLLFSGLPFIVPATALAVDISLKHIARTNNFELSGKNAVIIGRSLTVGKPTIFLFLKNNITPTVVHTKTIDTAKIVSGADIVVASCGVPKLVTDKWIKDGAVVLDVGIHSINVCDLDGEKCQLCGDVDPTAVLGKASILTAVPGGIGSVTSVLLFANAVKCWYKLNRNEEFSFGFER